MFVKIRYGHNDNMLLNTNCSIKNFVDQIKMIYLQNEKRIQLTPATTVSCDSQLGKDEKRKKNRKKKQENDNCNDILLLRNLTSANSNKSSRSIDSRQMDEDFGIELSDENGHLISINQYFQQAKVAEKQIKSKLYPSNQKFLMDLPKPDKFLSNEIIEQQKEMLANDWNKENCNPNAKINQCETVLCKNESLTLSPPPRNKTPPVPPASVKTPTQKTPTSGATSRTKRKRTNPSLQVDSLGNSLDTELHQKIMNLESHLKEIQDHMTSSNQSVRSILNERESLVLLKITSLNIDNKSSRRPSIADRSSGVKSSRKDSPKLPILSAKYLQQSNKEIVPLLYDKNIVNTQFLNNIRKGIIRKPPGNVSKLPNIDRSSVSPRSTREPNGKRKHI
ncbi:hypothetical protein SNEBB_005343 [Seison nebaliae]|nr:hypothetical protein SNEBB_005343 [Seison nebaliae]